MESDKNTTKIESSHAAISEYIQLSIRIAGVFEHAVENKAVKSFWAPFYLKQLWVTVFQGWKRIQNDRFLLDILKKCFVSN